MGLLELALLAGAAIYAGLVLIRYGSDGGHHRPEWDFHDPVHSVEHWAVWLGVMLLALVVRVVAPVFAMLSEASADVGDWFLSRRHHESH